MNQRHDLLIELGAEELPPTALKRLALAFRDGVTQRLDAAKIEYGAVQWYASPRRLAVLIAAVADRQPDSEFRIVRGPVSRAAGAATRGAA